MRVKTKMYRDHPLYDVWKGMKARCNNKNHKSYSRYGGKGVRVCEEWELEFISFYNWALSNGYEPGMQIDKDIKGNGLLYSPDTCCWVTQRVNCQTRSNVKLNNEIANEIRKSNLKNTELSKVYGVHPATIGKIKNNKKWATQ